jgi:hypothetical protein
MIIQRSVLAAIAALALYGVASAQALNPVESQSIDLGQVAGDAYYTVQPDGFHVVATFGTRGNAGAPVRFQAVLARGQSVTVSTPRSEGEAPLSVTISRQNDELRVSKIAVVD